jgi:hypothetical protein
VTPGGGAHAPLPPHRSSLFNEEQHRNAQVLQFRRGTVRLSGARAAVGSRQGLRGAVWASQGPHPDPGQSTRTIPAPRRSSWRCWTAWASPRWSPTTRPTSRGRREAGRDHRLGQVAGQLVPLQLCRRRAAAAFARKPLPQWKANSARKAIEQRIDIIASTGDATSGLTGLLNQPNALGLRRARTARPRAPRGATAAGSAPATRRRTRSCKRPVRHRGEDRHHDQGKRVAGHARAADRTARADRLALAPQRHQRHHDPAVLPRQSGHGQARGRWIGAREPARAPPIAWSRTSPADPDKVQLVIPQEFEQFPAQEEGMTLKTPCHARTAGVSVAVPALDLLRRRHLSQYRSTEARHAVARRRCRASLFFALPTFHGRSST